MLRNIRQHHSFQHDLVPLPFFASTYLSFIPKLREYVVQTVLFCPVTHLFWKIVGIFPC